MTTDTTPCPWCGVGIVRVSKGATVETWHTGYHVVGGAGLEPRERACFVAACNACEFISECNNKGALLGAAKEWK